VLSVDGPGTVDYWSDNLGHTFPLLDDEDLQMSAAVGYGGAIPYHVLLGRDLRIRAQGAQISSESIDQALDEEWTEVDRPQAPPVGESEPAVPNGPDTCGANVNAECTHVEPSVSPGILGLLIIYRRFFWYRHSRSGYPTRHSQ